MQFKTAIPFLQIQNCIRKLILTECNISKDSPLEILSLDAPENSTPTSLTLINASTSLAVRESLKAALVLSEIDLMLTQPTLYVPSIFAALSTLLAAQKNNIHRVFKLAGQDNHIHPTAVVDGILGGNVTVGAGAYIGKNSYIGEYSKIEANASILDNCIVGKQCHIQSGAVIGCAGFGFYTFQEETHEIPHWAGVNIEDQVWVGAQTVIAAGVLHPTHIGANSKLDSHVQIAHNVHLGKHAFLASQSGIAGSTMIGNYFRMGGNASIAGHLKLGDHVSVAACSGVTKNLPHGSVVAGFPARDKRDWLKQLAQQKWQTPKKS